MNYNRFVYGAQYYRAPTPEQSEWETDLANMAALGMSDVKFWVQWRWAERKRSEYYFGDIDKLMDIAYKNGLKVTLNVIFDVAPAWVYREYPDCRMVLADGSVVEEQTAACRQIGGFPGPCYSHAEAFEFRKEFLAATVNHFKEHPALEMWDVWNEPEQCQPHRTPAENKLSCYCPNCRKKFKTWVEQKYGDIENLNTIWGRCYSDFDEVETPLKRDTFVDFMDYRNFRLEVMTGEANMRLSTVKQYDNKHIVYLHTVPNNMKVFNSLTGVDDFELAKNCDVFGATTFSGVNWGLMVTSPARGKTCYNVESHIGTGLTNIHPKVIEVDDIVKEFLPQIALGIKGFMFWQYRPELLGLEAPAWGMVAPDGSDNSFSHAASQFIKNLNPYIDKIEAYTPQEADIAVLVSHDNEILHFCMYENTESLTVCVENYINILYALNYNVRFINSDMLINESLEGIRLLITPAMYALSSDEASAIAKFIADGGKLLSDAHLGAYCTDTGRHCKALPGSGLDKALGVREIFTTSPYRMAVDHRNSNETLKINDDVKKALETFGEQGGKYFPIIQPDGSCIIGAERFACVEGGKNKGSVGTWNCIAQTDNVIYCGTNISEGAEYDIDAFTTFMRYICDWAECKRIPTENGVRLDKISDDVFIINNMSDIPKSVDLSGYRGVFNNIILDGTKKIPAKCVDLYVPK